MQKFNFIFLNAIEKLNNKLLYYKVYNIKLILN